MDALVTPRSVFRGNIVVEPYPYCPICGDALRPDAWTSLEHFAICNQGTCVDGRFWRRVIAFILANIDRIPITHAYGLHWYTPRDPISDAVARFRAEEIANALPFESIGICARE